MIASMTSVESATVASSPPICPSCTVWPSLTGPPWVRSGLVSPAAMSLARSPSRREITSPRIEARVSTPKAPICTPMNTRTCPNGDQCVAMSTVARPVTQIVETAVKNASAKGVTRPSSAAKGSEKSPVKTRMSER